MANCLPVPWIAHPFCRICAYFTDVSCEELTQSTSSQTAQLTEICVKVLKKKKKKKVAIV